MTGQGIEISSNSVTNIIHAWTRQQEQQRQGQEHNSLQEQEGQSELHQNTSSTAINTSSPSYNTLHITDLNSCAITNSTDWPILPKNNVINRTISTDTLGIGGPLTSFLNKNTIDPPSSYESGPLNSMTLEEPVYVSEGLEAQVADINYNHVTPQDETAEEEEFEQPQQSQSPLSDSKNLSVTIDWDQSWERRFWARAMEEREERRKELELIQRLQQELDEQKRQIDQIRQTLEVRENKLFEVEELIPSAKQLKDIGISFDQALVWIDCIREKAEIERIDLTTATWKLTRICAHTEILAVCQRQFNKQRSNLLC